jgi:predicted PurR-regulated permease PerM
MPKKVELSCRTVIFTVLLLLGLYFLYQIRSILVSIFVAFILMAAINPTVERLQRRRLPRPLAILGVYVVVIAILVFILAGIFPPLIDQTTKLVFSLPSYLEMLQLAPVDPALISAQLGQLGSVPANVLKIVAGVVSNVIGVFFLGVTTFYLLVERERLDHYLEILGGKENGRFWGGLIERLERRLGGWVRAELLLMVIVGVMVYVGLVILGVNYALPLALLAGLLEVVPNIGPVISAVPAVVVGLAASPLTAIAVAALYFLVQQLENSLIVPQVMARKVGLRPLVVILALATGFELGQVAGAILAIPILLLILTILSEFFPSIFPENP